MESFLSSLHILQITIMIVYNIAKQKLERVFRSYEQDSLTLRISISEFIMRSVLRE